jgi:hypothetical protein
MYGNDSNLEYSLTILGETDPDQVCLYVQKL